MKILCINMQSLDPVGISVLHHLLLLLPSFPHCTSQKLSTSTYCISFPNNSILFTLTWLLPPCAQVTWHHLWRVWVCSLSTASHLLLLSAQCKPAAAKWPLSSLQLSPLPTSARLYKHALVKSLSLLMEVNSCAASPPSRQ